MNRNLAQLTTINLDSQEQLQQEFQIFADKLKFQWFNRHYLSMHNFTCYFSNLIDKILDEINLPYYDILLQLHHKDYYFEKEFLSTIHTDKYRNSCITIPIFFSIDEPVEFYNDNFIKIQSSLYNTKNPSLVNTGQRHAIKISNMENPRVLLQISYKHRFEDIIARNPSIWQVYE